MNYFSMLTSHMDVKKAIIGKRILLSVAIFVMFTIAIFSALISESLYVILLIGAGVGTIYLAFLFEQFSIQKIVWSYDQEFTIKKRKILLSIIGVILVMIASMFLIWVILAILIVLMLIPVIGWLFAIVAVVFYFAALYLLIIMMISAQTDYLVYGENFGTLFSNFGNFRKYFNLFKFDTLQYGLMILVSLILMIIGYIVMLLIVGALLSAFNGGGMLLVLPVVLTFLITCTIVSTILEVTFKDVIVAKLRG